MTNLHKQTNKLTNIHRHTVVESKNQTNLDIVFVAIIRMVSSSSKMHLMIVAWTVSNDAFVALLPPDCNTTPIIEYKCRLDHHHLYHSNQYHHRHHHHHHHPIIIIIIIILPIITSSIISIIIIQHHIISSILLPVAPIIDIFTAWLSAFTNNDDSSSNNGSIRT